MTINFYTVLDDNRVLQKNLGSPNHSITNAQVYRECSIMEPDFLVNYSSVIVNSNYVHVPDWGRYYYIDNVKAESGGRCIVHCVEDVLMGNVSSILSLNCNVIRSESKEIRKGKLIDRKMQVRADTSNVVKKFGTSTNFLSGNPDNSYLLTVIGGMRNVPPYTNEN